MQPIDDVFRWLGATFAALGGGGALKAALRCFAYRQGDIPVCHTRIMRSGKGLPWNTRIAVHPLPNGKTEITFLP